MTDNNFTCACAVRPIHSGTPAGSDGLRLGPGSDEAGIKTLPYDSWKARYGHLYRALGLDLWLPHVLTELDGNEPTFALAGTIQRQRGYCWQCTSRGAQNEPNPDVLIAEANDMADGLNRDHDRWKAAHMLAEHAAGGYNAYRRD